MRDCSSEDKTILSGRTISIPCIFGNIIIHMYKYANREEDMSKSSSLDLVSVKVKPPLSQVDDRQGH